jgi:glutamate/aspartate transport system substrate-binding protein
MEQKMKKCLVLIAMFAFSGTAVAEKFTGTLQKIAETGVITIGYNEESAPFSFKDTAGGAAGYSVDLCRRIAAATKEKLGLDKLEVRYVPVTLHTRFDAVESGEIDIECGSSTVTLSRQERVDFTLLTFVTGGSLVSKADQAILSTEDLSGKKVAVISDTTTEKALAGYLNDNLIDSDVVLVETDEEGMSMLDEGKVQAFASDQVVLIGLIVRTDNPADYALAQDLFSFEPYGFMVRRGDPDFRLVANRTLAQIYRTGQYQKLFNKWFGSVGVRPSPVLAAMYKLQALPE